MVIGSAKVLLIGEDNHQYVLIENALARHGFADVHRISADIEICETDLQSVRLLMFSSHQLELGLALASRLRLLPHGRFVYVVLCQDPRTERFLASSPSDMVDHVIAWPIDENELSYTILSTSTLCRLQKEYSNLTNELPGYKRSLQRDLFLLRQLQLSMMPRDGQLIAGTEVRLFFRPKTMVSGDQVGVFEVGNNCLGFYLIDVMGHGMPAAIRALGFSRLFTGLPHESMAYRERAHPDEPLVLRSSAEVMTVLNEVYQISDDDPAFICAIYGVFDRKSRTLDISVAGMPLPLIVQADGEICSIGQSDLPLGVLDQHVYSSYQNVIAPGSSLLLVSDGVVDAPGGAELVLGSAGFSRLLQACGKSHRRDLPHCLVQSIQNWAGRPGDSVFNDDATLMAMYFDPPNFQAEVSSAQGLSTTVFGLANPLSPGVIEQASQVTDSEFTVEISNDWRVNQALLIADNLELLQGLGRFLLSRGIQFKSINYSYFFTDGDTLFDGVDLVCLFANDRSFKAAKWIQLLNDAVANEHPFVLVLPDGGTLNEADKLSKLGADYFLPYPFDAKSFDACMNYAKRKVGIARTIAQKIADLESARIELLGDMETVARMQLKTLPKPLKEFKHLKFDWIYKPAQFVSGDFLGVLKISDSVICYFAIDAAGQGVLASIKGWAVARLLTGVLKMTTLPDKDDQNSVKGLIALRTPSAILEALNERIMAMPLAYRLQCTLVCGILDCNTGQGTIAIAGHPQPVITQSDGSVARLGHIGPSVGSSADLRFIDVAFNLRPGDRLHLFSDGLIQGMDPGGDIEEGVRKVLRMFARHASLPLYESKAQWEQRLNRRWSGEPQDVSLLMLELGETPIVVNRDIRLTELFDLYLPLLDKIERRSSFVQSGQVFETQYSENALIYMIHRMREWLSQSTEVLAERSDSLALLVYELGWNLRREKRNEASILQLQVVILQLTECIAVIFNDDGKPIVDEFKCSRSDNQSDWTRGLTTQFRHGLDLAAQIADDLSYRAGSRLNSMVAVLKY